MQIFVERRKSSEIEWKGRKRIFYQMVVSYAIYIHLILIYTTSDDDLYILLKMIPLIHTNKYERDMSFLPPSRLAYSSDVS